MQHIGSTRCCLQISLRMLILLTDSPSGLFLTWTVYGTFLPGDSRGWRHRASGMRSAQPQLDLWHRKRLQHAVILLTDPMRRTVESAIDEICDVRRWSLWASAARSNHIHVVLTAPECDPETVRDQLKAKSTRELRGGFSVWKDRPVWSANGDIEFLDSEEEIEKCVLYVREAQDRKSRDHLREP